MHSLGNWLFSFFGFSGTGSSYGFWSGFGSDLGQITLITGLVAFYWHHTCQGKNSCWRWAHHEYDMKGVVHKLCHVHHPELQGKKYRVEDFLSHHNAKRIVD